MTPSEWEVMRIIWTKRSISSLDVIEVMQRKRDWSESTIKTLLGRLTKKIFWRQLKKVVILIIDLLCRKQPQWTKLWLNYFNISVI